MRLAFLDARSVFEPHFSPFELRGLMLRFWNPDAYLLQLKTKKHTKARER